MTNTIDTNQVSELFELQDAISEATSHEDWGDRYDAVVDLIRTEKLKLLAEVSERVVGEDVPEFHDPGCYQYNGLEYCHCIAKPDKATNNLRNEQRETLTKLEAEL